MKTFVLTLILLLELILQATVFQFININGIYPNLVLITLVCFSIIYSKKYSFILGLIIGLFADILFNNIIGQHALCYMLTAYVISTLSSNIFKENLLAPLIFYPIGSLTYYSLYYLIHYFLGGKINFSHFILEFSIGNWLLNIIAILILYPFVLKIVNIEFLKPKEKIL